MRRKNFHKTFTFILILALLSSTLLLTGCSSSNDESEEDEKASESQEESSSNINWQDLYLKAFEDGTIAGYENMRILFIDKDFDSVPEMYYSYVAESSEKYLSASNNEDGFSTFTGSARINQNNPENIYVTSTSSSEITDEESEGYAYYFVHLLPTDEYLWGYTINGGELTIQSLTTNETYRANIQRGIQTGTSTQVFEFTGIATSPFVTLNSANLNNEFNESYQKAINYYISNDEILETINGNVDISDWGSIYKEYITERGLLSSYESTNAKIIFIDIDDNEIPDMVYSYMEGNTMTIKVFKLTEVGGVIQINPSNAPGYYSNMGNDIVVRFGYINMLERYGWVLVEPQGIVLYTEDFTVDSSDPYNIENYIDIFYLKDGSDIGISQYDKYTVCELVSEDDMPENAGKFTSIDTTTFDESFDESFDEAVSNYVPNSEIKNN